MSAQRVAVVTGTRAEFGLLTPVMRAIEGHGALELRVIAAGMHLVGEQPTVREVQERFDVHTTVPMQRSGETGRVADGHALARGIDVFADVLGDADCVLVLGDRIEAFAAASAASVIGVPVVHLHGGDVAEGVADEAMRHAITKLAHLHLPATPTSAQRIERMGEASWRVECVGSPAADVVRTTPELDERRWAELGAPEAVVLHHPTGLDADREQAFAKAIADSIEPGRTLWLAPNHDPGHECVMGVRQASGARLIDHLPSSVFTGLLKRLAREGGVLIGNSSCALIEGAIIGLGAVDIGPRQGGRERCGNVLEVEAPAVSGIRSAIERLRSRSLGAIVHPYGDGHTGQRIAEALARIEFSDPKWLRKRTAY